MTLPLTAAVPIAACISLGLTPVVRHLSLRTRRFGGGDGVVPPTGGIAVFLTWIACLLFLDGPVHIGLAVGAAASALIGFLDDVWPLKPVYKLALLAASACAAVGLGLRVDLTGTAVGDMAVTVVWLVWMANVFNVLDMMDGLSAGIGLIAAVALALLGDGRGPGGVLAGALAGFLVYNYHPARIYLGDTGSLCVGFTLGGLGVIAQNGLPMPQSVLCPLLILGVPCYEGLFLVVTRKRRGVPIMRASSDHVAQRLVRLGATVRGAVARIHVWAFVLAAAALLAAPGPPWLCGVYAASFAAVGVAVGIRLNAPDADPA